LIRFQAPAFGDARTPDVSLMPGAPCRLEYTPMMIRFARLREST